MARDSRDNKEGKANKDNRDSRDNKDSKEGKDNKDNRVSKDNKDNRVSKDNKDNRASKDNKGSKANKGSRAREGSRVNREVPRAVGITATVARRVVIIAGAATAPGMTDSLIPNYGSAFRTRKTFAGNGAAPADPMDCSTRQSRN